MVDKNSACRLIFLLCSALAYWASPVRCAESRASGIELQFVNGEIDSAVLLSLSQYRETPLNVPSGEVRLLARMYPQLQCDISDTALSRYRPWKSADIERFFMDYPQLRWYREILSFEPRFLRTGECAIRYSADINKIDYPQGLGTRFMLHPKSPVSIFGEADAGLYQMRWVRRLVELDVAPVVVSAGNFAGSFDRGLLTGRFWPDSHDSAHPWSSWRFGNQGTFNGVRCGLFFGQNSHIDGYIHTLPGEQFQAVQSTIPLCQNSSVSTGIIHMALAKQDSTVRFEHTIGVIGAAWSGAGVCIDGIAVTDAPRPQGVWTGVPFCIDARTQWANSTARLQVSYFPRGFYNPASAAYYFLQQKLNAADTAPSGIYDVSAQQTVGISPTVRCDGKVRFMGMADSRCLVAGFGIYGTWPWDFSLRYTIRSDAVVDEPEQTFAVQSVFASWESVRCDALSYISVRDSMYTARATVGVEVFCSPWMSIQPHCWFTGGTGRSNQWSVGICQRIKVRERIRGEWRIETPVPADGDEIHLNVQMSIML